ncbi:hypothetical protein [Ferroglobus placidus]|uniref:hypothetical protein n=1 Tax=Ferroglobus placidus TaxID=54261 RepID=UPI00145E5872|nr:hypothetical protein [Ferroglobus placidus]
MRSVETLTVTLPIFGLVTLNVIGISPYQPAFTTEKLTGDTIGVPANVGFGSIVTVKLLLLNILLGCIAFAVAIVINSVTKTANPTFHTLPILSLPPFSRIPYLLLYKNSSSDGDEGEFGNLPTTPAATKYL